MRSRKVRSLPLWQMKLKTTKRRMISLVLRYHYRGAMCFLHLEAADCLDSVGLTEKIIQVHERYGLKYGSNLVSQAHDGASVMSGKYSGLQSRMKEVAKHFMSIVMLIAWIWFLWSQSSPTSWMLLCDFTETMYLCLAHTFTTSGLTYRKKCIMEPPESFRGWVGCWYMARHAVLARLPAIVHVLEEIENSGDRAADTRGLLAQIDLQFIGFLVTYQGFWWCQIPLRLVFKIEVLWAEVLTTIQQMLLNNAMLRQKLFQRDKLNRADNWNDMMSDTFCPEIFYPVIGNMMRVKQTVLKTK